MGKTVDAVRDAYLARLGLDAAPLSVEALFSIHRAHVERVAYETLWIHFGERWSIDASESMVRIATHGRGGYCFHLNGALSELLRALGYHVVRHIGAVHGPDGATEANMANHLVLIDAHDQRRADRRTRRPLRPRCRPCQRRRTRGPLEEGASRRTKHGRRVSRAEPARRATSRPGSSCDARSRQTDAVRARRLDTVASVVLREIEGSVGGTHEARRVGSVIGEHGDADAHGDGLVDGRDDDLADGPTQQLGDIDPPSTLVFGSTTMNSSPP